MEIPIHNLMYRVDSRLDFVDYPHKNDLMKPGVSWPEEIPEQTTPSLAYAGPDARLLGSYPKTGIDVLIIGTGFAGLTAALECTRKGHNVRILERNATTDLAGDMYFMGLSATKFLKHWPEMQQQYKEISLHDAWIETFKHDGQQMLKPQKVADRLHAQGLDPGSAPGAFQMRPLVYKMLLDQVEKCGIDIQFGKRVVDYSETATEGRIELEDGTTLKADIVVAADGIGSKSQKLVGGQVRAKSSGRAMWRAVFPIDRMDANPEVREFFKLQNDQDPIVRTFFAPGSYALTLTRKDVVVWIINHDVTGSETESWSNTVEADEVLKEMTNTPGAPWAPVFQDLVRCTPPKTIINFALWWRDPQPSCTSPEGRVVQIGDCAHSFLPSSGNGATQAIEDAVTLASCLQAAGADKVVEAVGVHKRLRFVRNACAQKLGFSNAELLQQTDWEKVKIDPRKSSPKLPKWIWQHDAEGYAHENYGKVVESMKKGIPLEEDTSIPPNYPPGYKYEPWNIDQIMADVKAGKEVDLGPGEWL
ncbi:hypothetical protein LTR53_014467 [Teratosphaeriaceae sp. CCFEE 6253]|nr:hypothetical protein LTR53_014467 [Teratosphaeriaceae sp. CCFEE 6253]